MITPDQVVEHLREHFSNSSLEDFKERLGRYCPEIVEGTAMEESGQSKEDTGGQLILFRPQSAPLPLEAYLASALSGLSADQRQLVFHISDIVATVCEDLGISLYEPRKKTDPVHHADVQDAEVFRIDRERVLNSDLLIHLCHYPSTGSGEELDFAYNALVPIILIVHSESKVSRMVTGIPAFKLTITYTEPEDLRHELRDCLLKARPILEERKMAFSSYKANILGNKIRTLRESLGLTREDVANSIPYLSVQTLQHIEDSVDSIANPSLIQLRQIATVLKTTVAELVEPDLGGLLISTLEDWMTGSGRTAARFNGVSIKDRNRLLRRMLLRMIDSLEKEE